MTKAQIYRIVYSTTGLFISDKIFNVFPYKDIDRFIVDTDNKTIKFFIKGSSVRKIIYLKDYEE